LVRSLASMENDGQLVLVLEYLHGRTLRAELTRRGALPWQEALEHAARIAEALVVAHEQEPPIVHRDLKPENVMLTTSEGSAADAPATGLKVMDFGIAKVLEGIHATNTQSIGTLQYMSPEQIDARTIDARSDLYSLGLIFYEMIAGEPPFSSASPRELLNMQCTEPAPALDEAVRQGLPRGVEDLLYAMLEKKPDDRPANAREVLDKLSVFRSAGTSAGTRKPKTQTAPMSARPKQDENSSPQVAASRQRRSRDERISATPPRTDTKPSQREPSVPAPAPDAKKDERPRHDTIAIVEANAKKGTEVPTWLALAAIVLLSLVAGMTTYLVRLKSNDSSPTASTTTTSASPKAASSVK
jgi:serine/threonine-protein kinase